MAVDLTIARELVAQHGDDRHTLKRKLSDRYDDELGQVLWSLFRDGTLDVSADDGWWSTMEDAQDHYTAADVGALLIAACKHGDLGGLRSSWASEQDGWNIYSHCLVGAKIADPEPLIAAFRHVPEPMKSPFGLELVAHGVLAVEQLPEGALARLAREAVQEVGGQRIAERILKSWPLEVAAEALLNAASTPDTRIWSLNFLEETEAYATPAQLAGFALNIDYRDAVAKALEVLDRHPDGLADAIRARVPTHGAPQDYGITTALGWVARAAGKAGDSVDPKLADALLAGIKDDLDPALMCEILLGIDADRREAKVLSGIKDGDGLGWVPAAITDRTVAAAIDAVKGWKRGGRAPNGLEQVFLTIGAARPLALVAAYGSKAPHRVWFVRGLGGATDPAAIPGFVAALGDSVEEVREAAVQALASRPFAAAAVEEARKSKKQDVRDGAEKVAALLAAVEAPAEEQDPVDAMKESLTDDEKEAFDQAWRSVRYSDEDPAGVAAALHEKLGDRALAATYQGLFRSRGHTTPKLGFWRAVADLCPADAWGADLSLRMVAGFPLGSDKFDDSVAMHDRAIHSLYAWLGARYGAAARPAIGRLLADPDPPSGWDGLVGFALDQGWDEVSAFLLDQIPTGDAGTLRLALTRLGERALPVIGARLTASKADERALAAEALAAVPLAASLRFAQQALGKEKSAKVRAPLARAAYAASRLTDPEMALDARMAAYPGPAEVAGLPKLRWSDGTTLSDGAFQWVVARLTELSPTADDPDLAPVRSALERDSAAALFTALEKTHAGKQPAKTGWVVMSAAVLADEVAVARLGQGLDALARGGASAEAFARVEMLVRNGSPPALAALDETARTCKSQALKTRAGDALDRAAEALGVPRDEIADRVAPTLGFDAAGARPFQDGAASLVVRLGVGGVLELEDGAGNRVTKPSKAGTKALGELRKAVAAAVKSAVARLEQAMVTGRQMSAEAFGATFAVHPILQRAVADVTWSTFDADGTRTGLARWDQGFRRLDGKPVTPAAVGVVHPLELSDAERAALSGLRPPFPQLQRPVFAVPAEEAELKRIERYESQTFDLRRLRRTLEDRGWVRGEPQDAGAVMWYTKAFSRADLTAIIRLDPGFSVSDGEGGDQNVPLVELVPGRYGRDLPYGLDPVPPAAADGIVYSEVVADVEAALSP